MNGKKMIAKPDKIFKYERFNAQSLKNLKAQSIYFASPLLFNDPYDCAITTGFKKLDDNEVIQIRDKYLKTPGISSQAINEFVQSDIQKLRGMFHRIADEIVKNELNNFLTKKGVSCFSESNNDLLMWAHYGDCYQI